MTHFNATDAQTSPVGSVFSGQTANVPVTLAQWIQTALTTPGGDNDLASVLEWVDGRVVSQDDIDDLRHLTRDLHSPAPSNNWVDAADSDGDMYQALGSSTDALTDANFNNEGASLTIASNASTQVYVRLPIGVDHTDYRIVFSDGFARSREGNLWTVPSYPAAASTTYQYWRADGFTNYNGGAVKLQKREEALNNTFFSGRLEGAALTQIDDLQHLTRDLHTLVGPPGWEDAADADGDVYQVIDPGSTVNLTDANFNGNGASIELPEHQNDDTIIFVRLPAASDPTDFRITFDDRQPTTGNTWREKEGPTDTFKYYRVAEVNNYGNSNVQLEKKSASIGGTRYDGSLGGAALEQLPPRVLAGTRIPTGADGKDGDFWIAALDNGSTLSISENVFGSWVELARATERGQLKDLETLPAVADYEEGDLVAVDDTWYKLGITDESVPNIFAGEVGRDVFNTTAGERWRGISNSQSPNGFSTDGEFTANPNNTLSLLLASSSRHIRVAMKRSVYEAAKGSDFSTSDHIAIKVTMADGTTTDEAVLAYYNAYERTDNYIIWQHRHASDNYNLYDEAAGNDITIEFFTTSGSPPAATTTPLLTHTAGLKHWLHWPSGEDPTEDGRTALALAQANAARLDALDMHVDGVAEPIHSQTYDENTALLAPLAGSAGNFAISQTFNNILTDDLLVIDWKKCDHLNHHDEYVVPGSDTDSGRMYLHPRNFDNTEWNGEVLYGLDRAIQDNGAADTLNSWIVGSLVYEGSTLTFGLHLQQGGTRTNRNLKPQAGFSITLRIYRNSAQAVPTSAPFKGIELGRLVGHDSNHLGEQPWTALATGVTTADGPDTGYSHWLSIPMHSYLTLDAGLGIILEMSRTGVTTPFSQVFIPWHAIGNWDSRGTSYPMFGGSWKASGTSNNDRIEVRGRINAGRIELQAACGGADDEGTLHAYIAT